MKKGYFRRKAKDYGDNAPELLAAKDYGDKEPELPAGIHTGLVRYTLQQLRIATNNFSLDNRIGEDWFRGEIDYRAVAVKRLLAMNQTSSNADFIREINALSRIHHRNIISLIGFCISEYYRLLVLDFPENNSLEYHLYESGKGERLDWGTRRNIALGTARALAYLHHDREPQFIHKNIKPSTILLDSEFEAKVFGFDNAELSPYFESQRTTINSTMNVETLGPNEPIHLSYGIKSIITTQGDVYSFGCLLFNLITGKKELWPFDRSKAVKDLRENMLQVIVDPRLPRDYDPKEISCMVICAVVSTFSSPTDRPTMKQIVNVLEGHQTRDSFIRQILEIEGISPLLYRASPISSLVSHPPKSFTYPSGDMKSLPLSSSYMNSSASSSDMNSSSSEGNLVGIIGEDMKSLPLSSDMNQPASASYINPLPSSSEGDLVTIGEDMKTLSLSSDMNSPASSSYIHPLPSSSEGI